MKKLFLLALPLLALTFNSCSKDDGDSGGKTKLVKKVILADDEYEEYFYDNQGRVTKIIFISSYDNVPYTQTVQYNGNIITRTWDDGSYTRYTFDTNGYCIRQDNSGFYPAYIIFNYSNGYLSESKSYDEDNTLQEMVSYTWENGNIVIRDDGNYNASFTYDNRENKLNINMGYNDVNIVSPFRFKGMASKNHRINEYNESLEYTFDNDGYPTKIVEYDPQWGSEYGYATYITYY